MMPFETMHGVGQATGAVRGLDRESPLESATEAHSVESPGGGTERGRSGSRRTSLVTCEKYRHDSVH